MKFASLIAVAGLTLAASTAGAVSITNGSFEIGPAVTGPGFQPLGNGDTSITGWTVGGNSIDYISTYWTAEDGSYSLDMSGNAAGSISQNLSGLTVGHTYNVTFWLSGNPAGGSTVKLLEVGNSYVNPQTYSFNVSGQTLPGITWSKETYSFVAQHTTDTLTFTSLENSAYGPALDNVSIADAAVPNRRPGR